MRDQCEQIQSEGEDPIDRSEQDIRAVHLSLIAQRLLLGELDGVGGPDVLARHENVGHEAVFIRADGAEHDPGNRNERPQEDPEAHPRHAAQNAEELPRSEHGEQIRHIRRQSRAAAAEIDLRHGGRQQQQHAEPKGIDDGHQQIHQQRYTGRGRSGCTCPRLRCCAELRQRNKAHGDAGYEPQNNCEEKHAQKTEEPFLQHGEHSFING